MLSTLAKSTLIVAAEASVIESIEDLVSEKERKKSPQKTPLKCLAEALKRYNIITNQVVLLPRECDGIWGEQSILIDPWKNLQDAGLWDVNGHVRNETSRFGFDYAQILFSGENNYYLWMQGAESEDEMKRKIIVIFDASLTRQETPITERILENVWGRVLHYTKSDTKRRMEKAKTTALRFVCP